MQFEYISPEWEEEEMYWIWNKCFGEVAPHLILLPESNIARQRWVQTPWQWPIKVATDSFPRSLAFQIGCTVHSVHTYQPWDLKKQEGFQIQKQGTLFPAFCWLLKKENNNNKST